MQAEEKNLWDEYKKTKQRDLLEKIVEKYLDIVYFLTNKLVIFTSNKIDKDELYSAGVMGLLEAIERYDQEQGFEFKTYASKRIRGAIIDEIRRVDWVPRSVRQKARRIDTAVHALFNKLGRMPSDNEIALHLELDIEEYYQLTDNLGPMFLSSLDEQIAGVDDDEKLHLDDVVEDYSQLDTEAMLMREKLRRRIAEAIGNLPDKEKLVISLYYYEELTLKEIGKILSVSESRICQIHSSALIKLRNLLGRGLFGHHQQEG